MSQIFTEFVAMHLFLVGSQSLIVALFYFFLSIHEFLYDSIATEAALLWHQSDPHGEVGQHMAADVARAAGSNPHHLDCCRRDISRIWHRILLI